MGARANLVLCIAALFEAIFGILAAAFAASVVCHCCGGRNVADGHLLEGRGMGRSRRIVRDASSLSHRVQLGRVG